MTRSHPLEDKDQVQTCKPSQGGITRKYGSLLSHLKRLELPYEEPHLGSQECNIIEASARSEHVESIK